MKNKPNWKKGDIITLIGTNGEAIHIFEAQHNPTYGTTILNAQEDWYYGLRSCKEIKPATLEDIQNKIKHQKTTVLREQTRLNQLINFQERIKQQPTKE